MPPRVQEFSASPLRPCAGPTTRRHPTPDQNLGFPRPCRDPEERELAAAEAAKQLAKWGKPERLSSTQPRPAPPVRRAAAWSPPPPPPAHTHRVRRNGGVA
ncbi:hypothetical protein PVAP13_7NG220117 [Panicum virgatum]|uniref:Uncharacterized protein n=1 Tax=Panicum virgatum TaxID=38727 RepID=A0A8T0PX89_PANVG|nr:hypothetical protein PVAP13_7NG220117 [Panicum virgatum]